MPVVIKHANENRLIVGHKPVLVGRDWKHFEDAGDCRTNLNMFAIDDHWLEDFTRCNIIQEAAHQHQVFEALRANFHQAEKLLTWGKAGGFLASALYNGTPEEKEFALELYRRDINGLKTLQTIEIGPKLVLPILHPSALYGKRLAQTKLAVEDLLAA
jgi:hypothetical protein